MEGWRRVTGDARLGVNQCGSAKLSVSAIPTNPMERFYAPTSAEAQSFYRIKNDHFWDSEHASLTETLMGLCASYAALASFISGQDLYIPPRTPTQLFSALKRYAIDVLHNLISHSRTTLEPGGYSRACEIATSSLASVLAVPKNLTHLLELHSPPAQRRQLEQEQRERPSSPELHTRPIHPALAGGTHY